MGFLSGLLGQKNPADKAQPYLNQIAPMATGRLDPYVQRGNEAQGMASGQYNQLVQDPSSFINDLFSNYSMSEGFKNRRNESLRAARDAAATGGFSGTYGDQKLQAEIADSLASQGMQEWLNNVLGVYGTGLAGQQHVADQGFGANTDLTSILGSTLGTQAGLAFQGGQQKNQGKMDFMKILGQLGGAAIGGAFGGPAGAAAGSQVGGNIW